MTAIEGQTTELKLYSPLYAELFEADPEEEPGCGPQVLGGYELTGYQEAIRQGIEDERLPDEEERGLIGHWKPIKEKAIPQIGFISVCWPSESAMS